MAGLVGSDGLLQSLLGAPSRAADLRQRRSVHVLWAERATHERALVVDMDLGQIARVVEDVDLLSHKGGQCRLDVAPSAEADAIPPHLAGAGHA